MSVFLVQDFRLVLEFFQNLLLTSHVISDGSSWVMWHRLPQRAASHVKEAAVGDVGLILLSVCRRFFFSYMTADPAHPGCHFVDLVEDPRKDPYIF